MDWQRGSCSKGAKHTTLSLCFCHTCQEAAVITGGQEKSHTEKVTSGVEDVHEPHGLLLRLTMTSLDCEKPLGICSFINWGVL